MSKIDEFTKEELENLVKNSRNFADLIKNKLGYATAGGDNTKSVRLKLDKLGISYEHFNSVVNPVKRNPDNIFIENSTATQKVLRFWYKKENYSEYKCDVCGMLPIWNNKPLTLILDHKNGNNKDDRLENLHWVCPNCNQQLPTTGYHGKQKNCK